MKELLEKFKQEKKVISIHNDSADTERCWTGFVSEVDEDYVLIAHFSKDGFYDGFCLHAIDGILNIEQGTYYENKTHRLYELRKQGHPTLSLNMGDGLLEAILTYAKEEEIFISITLVEDDEYPPTGLVKELTEDFVCILNFDNDGTENGFSYIKKENIHQVFVDSLLEQNLALLYKDLNK